MCRNNEQWATSKGETWSRGTNSRKRDSLPLYSTPKNRLFVFNGDFLIELFSQKDKLHLMKGIYFLYLYVQ